MSEERRKVSLETIFLELGSIKQLSTNVNDGLNKLNEKVAIQNGRIGKLEQRQSFYQGAIALFTIFNLPIIFYFIKQIFTIL